MNVIAVWVWIRTRLIPTIRIINSGAKLLGLVSTNHQSIKKVLLLEGFLNHLQVELIPGSATRKLLVPLVYALPKDRWPDCPADIVVDRGFETDFASIPRILHSLFRPDAGDTRRPATLRDYLYCNHLLFNRYQSDEIFRQALKQEGASLLKRWILWAGVRLAGWLHWRN